MRPTGSCRRARRGRRRGLKVSRIGRAPSRVHPLVARPSSDRARPPSRPPRADRSPRPSRRLGQLMHSEHGPGRPLRPVVRRRHRDPRATTRPARWPATSWQRRHVGIQIQPIDGFQLEGHVIGQDFRNVFAYHVGGAPGERGHVATDPNRVYDVGAGYTPCLLPAAPLFLTAPFSAPCTTCSTVGGRASSVFISPIVPRRNDFHLEQFDERAAPGEQPLPLEQGLFFNRLELEVLRQRVHQFVVRHR